MTDSSHSGSGTALLEGRLSVITGDITRLEVDAVVNAANSSLLGGGGVDGAIHSAGGPAILEECRTIRKNRYPDGLPPGEAVQTTAGRMRARYVIHTVGPVWHGGTQGEPGTLGRCYTNSLALAATLGVRSIAFPAISTGVYGYPREEAARVVWDTLREYCRKNAAPAAITLVFYSPADARLFLQAAGSDS